jgi:hypothetical protein
MTKTRLVILSGVLALALAPGCRGGEALGDDVGDHGLKLTSPAFAEGQSIPKRFTCDGPGISPPLAWSGVPAGARSLALVVDDPDAPGGLFTHWIVLGLAAQADSLAEGAATRGLPPGAVQGVNDFDRPGYGGPCPPHGRHRYVHHLYALDLAPGVLPAVRKANRSRIDAALQGHILAHARLTGTYER